MLANIDNIYVIQDQNGFHIMTEFSRFPIETFNTAQEAFEFVNGYLFRENITAANRKGRLLRKFVEKDISDGSIYLKVNPLIFV